MGIYTAFYNFILMVLDSEFKKTPMDDHKSWVNPYESHVTMAYSKDAMKQRHAEGLRQASDETPEVAWYSPGQI